MDEAASWEERGKLARLGISVLDFMIGSWKGTGKSFDAHITATLVVRPILDGTWLEATETLFDANGQIDHQDTSMYRFDPDNSRLEVLHLMGHATFARHPIEPVGDALHWITGPGAPRLAIQPRGGGLRTEVQFPGEPAPAVTIDYKPA